jgi:CRP-like cAMP-binding protein
MEASGIAAAHRHRCLAAVEANPGLTAAEIAQAVGLERHEPSRRLPELRDQGLIINGDLRICRARGRRSLTWYPAGKAVCA